MMLCAKISIYFCHENVIISLPAAVADIQLLLHLPARQGNFKTGNFNHMNVCVHIYLNTHIMHIQV